MLNSLVELGMSSIRMRLHELFEIKPSTFEYYCTIRVTFYIIHSFSNGHYLSHSEPDLICMDVWGWSIFLLGKYKNFIYTFLCSHHILNNNNNTLLPFPFHIPIDANTKPTYQPNINLLKKFLFSKQKWIDMFCVLPVLRSETMRYGWLWV